MDERDKDVVIPIVSEELYADAVPVVTGGVRVTKRVDSHDEIVEQELRKSLVSVKRVRADRVVDGPQPARRVGDTLIIPVVSEVLRIEKQWVLTEEIHITQSEERETVQNKVTLNREEARIERIDAAGNVIAPVNDADESLDSPVKPVSILRKTSTSDSVSKRTRQGRSGSLLKNRRPVTD